MGLLELGITRDVILMAMDAMPMREVALKNRSKKIYVIDPRDRVGLWDIKELLRVAAEIKGVALLEGFTSDRYKGDIPRLGLSYVQFDMPKTRRLGIAGFDPEELAESHVVVEADGTENRNWALASGEMWPLYEQRVARMHRAWERRGVNTRQVKEAKGLICAGCDLDAAARFGRDLGMSCMEAHHLRPVCEMPPEGRVVEITDFVVLCATCHRIIHRLERPDDLTGLRKIVGSAS